MWTLLLLSCIIQLAACVAGYYQGADCKFLVGFLIGGLTGSTIAIMGILGIK